MTRLGMIFKAAVYACIFLSRIRFPSNLTLTEVIRKRYNDETVKLLRKFEKLDFKYKKTKLDLTFLNNCLDSDLIPKFLQFRVANKLIRSSEAYHSCQLKLLNEEIKFKQSRLKRINNELSLVSSTLRNTTWIVDFAHIISIQAAANDKRINEAQFIHEKKFSNLKNSELRAHKAEDVIHNLSSYVLSEPERTLLVKGLNFTICPQRLNYADYCVRFEKLFRDIKNIENLEHANLDFLKSKLKDTALSSFRKFNQKSHSPGNLTSDEFTCLKKLGNDNNLIIQKSDKGNSIVIIDRDMYFSYMNTLLTDVTKFKKLDIKAGKELQTLEKSEVKVRDLLNRLKDGKKISSYQFNGLYPIGSRPGILYGLAKIHKALVDGVPKFRPILSSIGTVGYKLAKFLVPIMTKITSSEYSIQNSFTFGKEILEQDCKLFMGSLDVESLFTSIPLDETINICTNLLFQDKVLVEKLTKDDFKDLLSLAIKDNIFLFDSKYYSQIDGVAMGSPLGPTLANAFMSFHEKNWLENCPLDFKPTYYRRYVDDIFVLCKDEDQLKKIKNYLNQQHPNISFTSDVEKEGVMPFLDYNISRENNNFVTSVYRKPTFTGVYSHFESLIPASYKIGLILTLLHRIYCICSSYKLFHIEVEKLTEILKKNMYPLETIHFGIRKFLNKRFDKKPVTQKEEVKPVFLILPFLGKESLKLRTLLFKIMTKNLPKSHKIMVIFKSQTTISQFLKFKDTLPEKLMSHIIYKYKCDRCDSIYYGLTMRHVQQRWSEHMGISPYTGKAIVGIKGSVRDHSELCDSNTTWDNFEIVARDDDPFTLKMKESLLIKRDNPHLNKDLYSTPLYLFN